LSWRTLYVHQYGGRVGDFQDYVSLDHAMKMLYRSYKVHLTNFYMFNP